MNLDKMDIIHNVAITIEAFYEYAKSIALKQISQDMQLNAIIDDLFDGPTLVGLESIDVSFPARTTLATAVQTRNMLQKQLEIGPLGLFIAFKKALILSLFHLA